MIHVILHYAADAQITNIQFKWPDQKKMHFNYNSHGYRVWHNVEAMTFSGDELYSSLAFMLSL